MIEWEDGEEIEQCCSTWHIQSADDADWVLSKLGALEHERATIVDQQHKAVEEINRRAADLLRPIDNKLHYFRERFDAELRAWLSTELAHSSKKSVNLLHGTVGLRQTTRRAIVSDEALAIQTAIEHELPIVRVKHELDKRALLKTLDSLPEDHPLRSAVSIAEPEDELYVKAEYLHNPLGIAED